MGNRKPIRPQPVEMDDFIQKYVHFAEKVIEAESDSKIPVKLQSTPDRIHEMFRFWYVDCRDREDIARMMDQDSEDRNDNDKFWEQDL